MAVINQGLARADAKRLANLLAEAGHAEHDYLPEERITGYLARLEQGTLECISAVEEEVLVAALLYSRFGPLYPAPGSFLRLSGLYVDEVVVSRHWRRNGWSRRLLAKLREIASTELDIYIDCDAANAASVAMMHSAGYLHVADYADQDRTTSSAHTRTTSLFRQPGRPVCQPRPAPGVVAVG